MPGPASFSHPSPLPSFFETVSGGRRPEDSARLGISMVGGLETGEPLRSRNPHGSLCDKAAPPFFMQVRTCSQAGADFAPSVWCYCRFRDAQVLRNRVQVAWRRGEEGDLQIVILENGLAPLLRACGSNCCLWKTCLRTCIPQRAHDPTFSLRPVVLDAARRVRAAPVVEMG